MKKILALTFCVFLCAFGKSLAQSAIPRLFLDAPHIYMFLPNVKSNQSFDRAGLGLDVAMNVATYNAMARAGGSFATSAAPKADDLGSSVLMHYGGFVEAGAGLFRTNGNQCAKNNRGAYTAMAVGGVRYRALSKELVELGENGIDYTLGVELGRFYIKDIIRNTEFVLRSDYHFKQELISINIGFKVFWNLKGQR
jgi:hypothetical protein